MSYKTYYVYDNRTGYILSGYYIIGSDSDNPFTTPYKYPEFHSKDQTCVLDYIFHSSRREGLSQLRYEDLVVCENKGNDTPVCHFVKNRNYILDRYATRGWWQLEKDEQGNWITSRK